MRALAQRLDVVADAAVDAVVEAADLLRLVLILMLILILIDAVVEAADLFAARRVKRRCSRPWEGPQPRRHSGGAAVAAGLGARQRVLSLLA